MEQNVLGKARMNQEEFQSAGLIVGVEAEGTSTCYDDGRMDVLLYTDEGIDKARNAGFEISEVESSECSRCDAAWEVIVEGEHYCYPCADAVRGIGKL